MKTRLNAMLKGLVRWLILLPLVCGQAYADTVLRYAQQGNAVTLHTETGQVVLTALAEHSLSVEYRLQAHKRFPAFAVADNAPSGTLSVEDQGAALLIKSQHLTARVQKSPLQIRYSYHGKPLIEEEVGAFVTDTLRGFRFRLQPDEKLIGGGQRVLGMDRRGQRLPLYNRAHYGYGTESQQMYYGLPAVMSSRHYALVFDNSAKGTLDIGASDPDILQFEAATGRLAYLVVAGEDYPGVIAELTAVTGRQPLPPRWALGHFASRFGYKTEQQTRDVVQRLIDAGFPLDAVVLDLYWFGPDIKGHMGNLAWDREAFPQPETMMADFHKQGVETILITEPFVLTTSKRWAQAVDADALALDLAGQPKRFDFYFGNTGLIDVFHPPAQQWFADIYSRLYEQGVRGWWGDLGEPEVHPADTLHRVNGQRVSADAIHNAYGHQWAKLVYENQQRIAPNTRPLVMMRAGFMGSQRYGMIPWTGDVSRSWDGLKPQVELTLQMGMLGLAYTHSDLGGFAGGEAFDREMYIRWLQYGVFQPVYRPHAQGAIAPEPVFHDALTQNIVRDFITLRYQLLPYNYSLAYENSLSGMPLMRPMMFYTEQPDDWFAEKDQYFWGDAFVVKPVTAPGVTSVDMRLPPGFWFDFWHDTLIEGGQSVQVPTSLSTLPVLVKAGAFVPMAPAMQHTKLYDGRHLQLHYYHHPTVTEAAGQMFEDDGQSANALSDSHYRHLQFNASYQRKVLTLQLDEQGDYPGAPPHRAMQVVLHGVTDVSTVRLGDSTVPESRTPESGSSHWYRDAYGRLVVTFTWHAHQPVTLTIQ